MYIKDEICVNENKKYIYIHIYVCVYIYVGGVVLYMDKTFHLPWDN